MTDATWVGVDKRTSEVQGWSPGVNMESWQGDYRVRVWDEVGYVAQVCP